MRPPRISGGLDDGVDQLWRTRCHENSIESYRVFARTTPGGIVDERDGLVLTDSRARDSMGNAAIATTPTQEAEHLISQAESFYAPTRRPWILFALPPAAPGLETAAVEHGLRDKGWFPGLLLHPFPTRAPRLPSGVEVRKVESVEELQLFERTASKAYDVESGPVYPGWLTYPGFSFHLAYFRGEPVATATLVASHGIAGIVYVGTKPEARGHGFARAAVWAAIMAGRDEGMLASALWATPMGLPMYEQMGFRTITNYRIWSPSAFPLPPSFSMRPRDAGPSTSRRSARGP